MRPMIVFLATVVGCVCAHAARAAIPLEAFARIPAVARPALSPDGKKVVAIAGLKDLRVAMVLDLTTGKAQPVLSSMLNKFDITWCDWANATRTDPPSCGSIASKHSCAMRVATTRYASRAAHS